jgi:hypothetical protein
LTVDPSAGVDLSVAMELGFDVAHPGEHAAPEVADPEVVLRQDPRHML